MGSTDRHHVEDAMAALREKLATLPEAARTEAEKLLAALNTLGFHG